MIIVNSEDAPAAPDVMLPLLDSHNIGIMVNCMIFPFLLICQVQTPRCTKLVLI